VVAGNWKMNLTRVEVQALATEITEMMRDEVRAKAPVILFPPNPYLLSVGQITGGLTYRRSDVPSDLLRAAEVRDARRDVWPTVIPTQGATWSRRGWLPSG
jgi:hypothetical protein